MRRLVYRAWHTRSSNCNHHLFYRRDRNRRLERKTRRVVSPVRGRAQRHVLDSIPRTAVLPVAALVPCPYREKNTNLRQYTALRTKSKRRKMCLAHRASYVADVEFRKRQSRPPRTYISARCGDRLCESPSFSSQRTPPLNCILSTSMQACRTLYRFPVRSRLVEPSTSELERKPLGKLKWELSYPRWRRRTS